MAQATPQELTDAFATAFKANAGWNASDERPLPDAFLPFRDRTGTRAIGGERAFTGCLGNDRVWAKAVIPLRARNSLHRPKTNSLADLSGSLRSLPSVQRPFLVFDFTETSTCEPSNHRGLGDRGFIREPFAGVAATSCTRLDGVFLGATYAFSRRPLTRASGMRAGNNMRLKYSNPMYIDDVAVDFPDMTIIMAHPSFQ